MAVPERLAGESDDNDKSRNGSGVFRRIMARDLYDVTKRVEELEQSTRSPLPRFLTSWLQIALMLLLVILFIGSVLYLGHRVDEVELLQQQELLALRSELESANSTVDGLQQTIRLHSRSLVSMNASSSSAADMSEAAVITVEESDAAPDTTETSDALASDKPRERLPTHLEPGEVLLIVASTRIRQDAISQARALELDGHASEVILGVSDYYGIALGRFDFEQAKTMKSSVVESGIASTPYLITDESIEAYVYP